VSWIARSLPSEPELDASPPATPLETLEAERLQLIRQIRPRIRSKRQERIRRQISEITCQMMRLERL
jgi:hypothetical protein